MRQFAIDHVSIAWLALDFKEGLAVGSSITEARTTPSFTVKSQGANSKVVRVYNTDRSGTLTFLVDQESVLQQSLKGISNSERVPGTRDKVAAMVITDHNSGEQRTYKNAFIMTEPDFIRGTESQVFSWVFGFEDYEDEEVSTLANTVGD
jgi:hypothetical protein